MAKRRGRKSVPKINYKKYQKVAEHFFKAAEDSLELEYWTAAGVLIVHSAIAFSDALSIKLSGKRSTSDNHEDTITLVENAVVESQSKVKAINQLKRIIEEKTKVSYLGELYSASQTKDMWKRLVRFRKWAIDILMR